MKAKLFAKIGFGLLVACIIALFVTPASKISSESFFVSSISTNASHSSISANALYIERNNNNKTIKQQYDLLVNVPGCRIYDINPMDHTIKQFYQKRTMHLCAKSAYLPLTSLIAGKLALNNNATESKTVKNCQYRAICRPPKDDWKVIYKDKISFNNSIEVTDEFIEVTCFDNKAKQIYKNYHIQVMNRTMQKASKRLNKSDDGKLSVLLVGIDSMSRLNFLRHGKKLHEFITTTMGGLEMFGLNKVGYGTLANLTPLLTGKFLDELPWTKSSTPFDGYNIIWKNFSENNYATLFGEDYANGFTFNYAAGGFIEPPVTHYNRPFIIAVDKVQLRTDRLCVREKRKTKVLLDWMADLAKTYQNNKYFGFLMFTNPTHDDYNGLDRAKDDYYEFLKTIHESKVLDNTVIHIFGDHGPRQGGLRETHVGRYEAMLPFHYVILPKRFKAKYPKHYANVLHNQRRLVTLFDIHETLKDFMNVDESSTGHGSTSKRGISLFKRIPDNRTCTDAGIPPQYCMCHYNPKNVPQISDKTLITRACTAAVGHINDMLKPVKDKCAHFKVAKGTCKVYLKHKTEDRANYIVRLTVSPGGAKFEVTINYHIHSKTFTVLGNNIDRINLYGLSSSCVANKKLKLFCYCKQKNKKH